MPRIDKPQSKLSARRKQVLFATIAEYVATGRPVSSQSLIQKHGLNLSPATVRRELNALTKQGFLTQPHVSAGRIPSARAFRVFSDILKSQAGRIDTKTRDELTAGFNGLFPGETGSWQDVVRILSDISYQAALVVTPALSDSTLRQLRFIPCGPGSLLAVIVTREGLVHNAYVESKEALDDRDLEQIHNYLNELIDGRTLNQVRLLLKGELEDARSRCDALRERATILGSQAIQSRVEYTSKIVVDGRSHLLAKPDLKDRIDELLLFLEEKTRILNLLDRAAESDHGPTVIIGEGAGERLEGCAIITSPFGGISNQGQVGIIGSMRMDYSALIPIVALAAQFLSAHILGDEESSEDELT